MPRVRLAASRTAANASGRRSSSDSPLLYRSRSSTVSCISSSSVSSLKSSSSAFTALAYASSRRRVRPSPTRRTFSSTEATYALHLSVLPVRTLLDRERNSHNASGLARCFPENGRRWAPPPGRRPSARRAGSRSAAELAAGRRHLLQFLGLLIERDHTVV